MSWVAGALAKKSPSWLSSAKQGPLAAEKDDSAIVKYSSAVTSSSIP